MQFKNRFLAQKAVLKPKQLRILQISFLQSQAMTYKSTLTGQRTKQQIAQQGLALLLTNQAPRSTRNPTPQAGIQKCLMQKPQQLLQAPKLPYLYLQPNLPQTSRCSQTTLRLLRGCQAPLQVPCNPSSRSSKKWPKNGCYGPDSLIPAQARYVSARF